MRWRTRSAAETERVGGELAAGLRPGDAILLSGELGAGKTTLVRGAARALGVSGPVTSPTFTIGQLYRGDGVTVAHLDLYRLGSLAGEDPDLLADYVGPDTIAFVEWPGVGLAEIARLAAVRYRVDIAHAGGDVREVSADPPAGPEAGR